MDRENERWVQYWVNHYRWALEGRGDLDVDDRRQAALLGIEVARRSYRAGEASWATYSGRIIQCEMRKALGIRQGALPPRLVSLDVPLARGSDETLMDTLVDENLPNPDERLLHVELQTAVRQAVAKLKDPRKRRCVQAVELDGQALARVAESMGLSVERARQLIYAAHRRLRDDRRLRALAEREDM